MLLPLNSYGENDLGLFVLCSKLLKATSMADHRARYTHDKKTFDKTFTFSKITTLSLVHILKTHRLPVLVC